MSKNIKSIIFIFICVVSVVSITVNLRNIFTAENTTSLLKKSNVNTDKIWDDMTKHSQLRVPFKIKGGGYLKIAYGPYKLKHSLPPIGKLNNDRLVLIQGDKKILLDSMDKLKGHFIINTEEEALALARLKTSPKTTYLWSGYYSLWDYYQGTPQIEMKSILSSRECEVVCLDALSVDFFFGDKDMYSDCRGNWFPNKYCIVLNESKLKSCGIEPIKIIKKQGYFEIHRTLITDMEFPKENEDRKQLNRVTEEISYDGSYKRTINKLTKLENTKLWD